MNARNNGSVDAGAIITVALISLAGFVAFWGTVIYVLGHFIGKFW